MPFQAVRLTPQQEVLEHGPPHTPMRTPPPRRRLLANCGTRPTHHGR
jgi:hypothetical protein